MVRCGADADLDELRGNSDAVLVLDKEVNDAANEIKKLMGVRKIENHAQRPWTHRYRIVGKTTPISPGGLQTGNSTHCPCASCAATAKRWRRSLINLARESIVRGA